MQGQDKLTLSMMMVGHFGFIVGEVEMNGGCRSVRSVRHDDGGFTGCTVSKLA